MHSVYSTLKRRLATAGEVFCFPSVYLLGMMLRTKKNQVRSAGNILDKLRIVSLLKTIQL